MYIIISIICLSCDLFSPFFVLFEVICIAGPTSSGKTTFATKLCSLGGHRSCVFSF